MFIFFVYIHTAGSVGRASVNPPDLRLKWGDFNFAGSHVWKVPPTSMFQVGGTSAFQAWHKSGGVGSRWLDPAVNVYKLNTYIDIDKLLISTYQLFE